MGPPTRWVRLDLTRSTFDGSGPSHLTLEACYLDNVRLNRSWFSRPHLTGCVFVGPVENCVFDLDGEDDAPVGSITDCEFSRANLSDVVFFGLHPASLGIAGDLQPWHTPNGREGIRVNGSQ